MGSGFLVGFRLAGFSLGARRACKGPAFSSARGLYGV